MRQERQKSFLERQYDDLSDALDRVQTTRRFSCVAGLVFLTVVAAGGWQMYASWFKKSIALGWVGVGMLLLYGLILLVVLPLNLRPVVTTYKEQLDINTRERAAEDKIDAVLRTLDEAKYTIFRNVYLGYGDIDHVVIGPTGIFVIETKSNRGAVKVEQGHLKIDGKDKTKKDYERQAAQESYQLKIVLSDRLDTRQVYVEPVLAFPAASSVPEGAELRRISKVVPVRVVHQKDLVDVIVGHRTGMNTTTIEACKKAMQDIVASTAKSAEE